MFATYKQICLKGTSFYVLKITSIIFWGILQVFYKTIKNKLFKTPHKKHTKLSWNTLYHTVHAEQQILYSLQTWLLQTPNVLEMPLVQQFCDHISIYTCTLMHWSCCPTPKLPSEFWKHPEKFRDGLHGLEVTLLFRDQHSHNPPAGSPSIASRKTEPGLPSSTAGRPWFAHQCLRGNLTAVFQRSSLYSFQVHHTVW